ncbi:hypothetical protein HAX54_044048 [Datura stramonium]|uniref:Uncharacterized protein n=1 Tax=Datura stramonium TaxID=4076 RepID=A0ABS8W3P9_DATST|nr:hypothetical protein [Datura stramonium]
MAHRGACHGGFPRQKNTQIGRPRYDLKRIDLMKTKDPEGIHGPVLSISECHERIDNMLTNLYIMQMLQCRMNRMTREQLQQLNMDYPFTEHLRGLYRVRPRFEGAQDDDDAINEEQARAD